jgi:hypothetical protein
MNRFAMMASMIFLVVAQTAFAALPKNADTRLAVIDDPVRVSFAGNAGRQKIQRAIVNGASAARWRVVKESDGRVDLTTTVNGKHVVNLQIAYDDAGYQINMIDTVNLMYQEFPGTRKPVRAIHKNYNVWIRELSNAINNGLGEPMQAAKGVQVAVVPANVASQPALPDSGFAAIGNLEAVPVRPEGRERYALYLTMPQPRAFVVTQSGGWRFWYNSRNSVAKAMEYCQAHKIGCWLYAVDDRVVWNADPEKRTPRPGQMASGSE